MVVGNLFPRFGIFISKIFIERARQGRAIAASSATVSQKKYRRKEEGERREKEDGTGRGKAAAGKPLTLSRRSSGRGERRGRQGRAIAASSATVSQKKYRRKEEGERREKGGGGGQQRRCNIGKEGRRQHTTGKW
jgi:hypothetical protein